jgi:hypothetical protein
MVSLTAIQLDRLQIKTELCGCAQRSVVRQTRNSRAQHEHDAHMPTSAMDFQMGFRIEFMRSGNACDKCALHRLFQWYSSLELILADVACIRLRQLNNHANALPLWRRAFT